MDADRPRKLKVDLCIEFSKKAVKRSKNSGTTKMSISRDVNHQDNSSDGDDPVPIELWNGALQQLFPLISP